MAMRKDFSYYLAIMVHLLEFMCLLVFEDIHSIYAGLDENHKQAGSLMAGNNHYLMERK